MRQFVRRVDELSGAMSGGLFRTDGGAMGGSSSGLDVSDIAEAWQRIRAGSAGEAWVLLETWLGSWAAGQLGSCGLLKVSFRQKFQGKTILVVYVFSKPRNQIQFEHIKETHFLEI